MQIVFLIFFIMIIGLFAFNEAFAEDVGIGFFGPRVELTVDETHYELQSKMLSDSLGNLEDKIYSPVCAIIIDGISDTDSNYLGLDLEYRITVTDHYGNHDLDNYHEQVGPIRFQSTDYNELVPKMKFNNGYHTNVKCEIWDN